MKHKALGKTKRFHDKIQSLEGWVLIASDEQGGKCVCGTPIKYRFTYVNFNGDRIILGIDCARKLGDPVNIRNPYGYLALVERLVSGEKEQLFVESLQEREKKFKSSLKLSEKQIAWLERITKIKWKFGRW